MINAIATALLYLRGECIGVVITYDENNPGEPYKYRMGVVPPGYQVTDQASFKYVMDRCAKIDGAAAVAFINAHGRWEQGWRKLQQEYVDSKKESAKRIVVNEVYNNGTTKTLINASNYSEALIELVVIINSDPDSEHPTLKITEE